MTPLGEKLIELMRPSCGNRPDCFFAPDIPSLKLNNLRETTRCPSTEEIYVLKDDTLWGSAKDGILYCSGGVYAHHLSRTFYTWRELYQMFNEHHSFKFHNCFVGKNKEYLIGDFWQEFFDFYAQYSGSAEVSAKPAAGGIRVCEYCGKKFDASQDTCPGCGAPA